jgi:hypothetical protein
MSALSKVLWFAMKVSTHSKELRIMSSLGGSNSIEAPKTTAGEEGRRRFIIRLWEFFVAHMEVWESARPPEEETSEK